MTVAPELKVFIAALRAGKHVSAALTEYCWAKLAKPVERKEHRPHEHWEGVMPYSALSAADAFDDNGDDEAIVKAWTNGAAIDREQGIFWRAMAKDERPTAGQLIRAMGNEERLQAAEIFGITPIAKMMLSR